MRKHTHTLFFSLYRPHFSHFISVDVKVYASYNKVNISDKNELKRPFTHFPLVQHDATTEKTL